MARFMQEYTREKQQCKQHLRCAWISGNYKKKSLYFAMKGTLKEDKNYKRNHQPKQTIKRS
jgi:hypothetical protein